MNKNLSIKILSAVVVSIVIMLLIHNSHQSAPIEAEDTHTNNFNAAIASQFNDNIRDVSARLLETQQRIQAIQEQQETLQKTSATIQIPTEITDAIRQLKEELNALQNREPNAQPDYPIEPSNSNKRTEVLEVEPAKRKRHVTRSKAQDTPKSIPYYTIPAGADLNNTTPLSALIGEVPSEGKLMQPLFPFTALISSRDLIASNGVALPAEISGMKVSGYAIGVGSFLDNISCVRAYVTSALFTFEDGHFVTVGLEDMKNTTDLVNNESLGYLTTSFGNPCIHGKYFTNAPRVLTAMLAAGGTQGLGSALSQWQMSTFSNGNGVTQTPTGAFMPFIAGGALSEGSIKVADWLEKRIQGSFDMVFVPASTKTPYGYQPTHLNLHLIKTIQLDKEPNGRLLNYAQSQTHIYDNSL